MSETRLRNKFCIHLSNASNCENGLNETLLLCYDKIMELCKKELLSHCILHIRDVNQHDCELHQEAMDWITENLETMRWKKKATRRHDTGADSALLDTPNGNDNGKGGWLVNTRKHKG
jgi:hypothetical protein